MNAQGVNTAVEDGAAHQVLLTNIKDRYELSKRVLVFEDLRLTRTAMIQYLSIVPAGMEKAVAEKIERYLKGHKPILSIDDRNAYILD